MSFLTDNIRLILHMRQRLHRDNMLGLCLGAGVSADLHFPTWSDLLQKIAEHNEIQGTRLLEISQSLTSQAQFLFQKYKQSLEARGEVTRDPVVDHRHAKFGWLDIVHECLYKQATIEDSQLKSHPYLWDLLPLVKQSAMTVNYNFDDSIERMLYLFNEQQPGVDEKGFDVVWQPSTQFRRTKGVIYHPNGFLPLRKTDGFSEDIIFLEQEYADQLIDVGGGHYACLLNHMSKTTLLFLGLSLQDTTLKHLLRISARNSPGTFHYHIHWCQEEKPSEAEQQAICRANFSVYNLVTLFLTTDEIKNLVKYVMMEKEVFASACDDEPQGINTNYRFYITGVVGAGKTTAIEQIRSVDSFDEWVDRKHQLLSKPHQELTPNQRDEVDIWINKQFRKKNRRVSEQSCGISIIDRCPLDPLYFIEGKAAYNKRAKELIDAMVPQYGSIKEIAPGHLIVLTCNETILITRLANRQKKYTLEQLKEQKKIIETFWEEHSTTLIDTTNLSINEVVKSVLEYVLFGEYYALSFQTICETLRDDA